MAVRDFISRMAGRFGGASSLQTPVSARGTGGWAPIISEPFAGAWQRNMEISGETIVTQSTVFACITLIAADISKLRPRYVRRAALGGVWREAENPAYGPVLRRPNDFQTPQQFYESWINSKLVTGNAYILLGRNGNGNVDSMQVLNPATVQPLVADDGDVYYEIMPSDLDKVKTQIVVPARDIIHDRFNCLFHPLVGMSPIAAAALAADASISIQGETAATFKNRGVPSGILTAPGNISKETAERLSASWKATHGGKKAGGVALLDSGVTFNPLTMKAVDAQLIEQLRWTSETVCSVFHVPLYKVGVGPLPSYNNVAALNTEYYTQALQSLIEAIEVLLDRALMLGGSEGVEFDLEGLIRMDYVSQVQTARDGVAAGIMTPNEARTRLGLDGVTGGDTPYMQQQMWPLDKLAERDIEAPAPALPSPEPEPVELVAEEVEDNTEELRAEIAELRATIAALSTKLDSVPDHAPTLAALSAKLDAVPDHSPALTALSAKLDAIPDHAPTLAALSAKLDAVPDHSPALTDLRVELAQVKHLHPLPETVNDLKHGLSRLREDHDKLASIEPEALAVKELSAAFDSGARELTVTINGHAARCVVEGVPSYEGVWSDGDYRKGSLVTFGGCVWIAREDTSGKPGFGKDWQLAVKKGRDGKDLRTEVPKRTEPVKL